MFEFLDCPLIPRNLDYPNHNDRVDLLILCIRMQTPIPITIPFPSTISQWNSLPTCVATAPSVKQRTLKYYCSSFS